MSDVNPYADVTPLDGLSYQSPPVSKLSRLAITSFFLSLAGGLCAFGFVAFVVVHAMFHGRSTDRTFNALIGLGILFGGFIAMVSILVGIIALFLPQRGKVFAVMGICFSALIVLGIITLMIIGMMRHHT